MSAKDMSGVAGLPDLPRVDLVDLWREAYGAKPPKGISRNLLLLAIAYKQQEKHYGGLSRKQKRLLLSIAEAVDCQPLLQQKQRSSSNLAPGTRLVREWHGKTHVVEMLRDGCLWDGRLYPSLTAVAKAITGSHRSGPKFFGL